jgi:hypothetical protein
MTMPQNWTVILSQGILSEAIPSQVTPAEMPVATAVAQVALVAVGTGLLWRGRKAVAQTTLRAAWWWALASWVAVVGASLAAWLTNGRVDEGDWLQSLEMAAAMTTVCPAMAVLGAKRPQHVAWQWIVLSLWVVLSLPAAEWLLFAAPPNVHAARRWFLLVLLVPGVVNYLPTRHWPSALLFAAGQVELLAAYLPGGSLPAGDHWLPALGLIVAALALAQRPKQPQPLGDPLDRLWRDFCNLYGIVWGLRVAERFNASAAANRWPVRLAWRGFRSPTGDGPPVLSAAERKAVADNLSSWLRRFQGPQGTALDAGSCSRRM